MDLVGFKFFRWISEHHVTSGKPWQVIPQHTVDLRQDESRKPGEIILELKEGRIPELYAAALVYLLKTTIKRISRENCHGCSIDHPSQIQHMQDGGCLDDTAPLVWFNNAMGQLSTETVTEFFHKVISTYGFDAPHELPLSPYTSNQIRSFVIGNFDFHHPELLDLCHEVYLAETEDDEWCVSD